MNYRLIFFSSWSLILTGYISLLPVTGSEAQQKVDGKGYLLLTDAKYQRILRFDLDGKYSEIITEGIRFPWRITYDDDGSQIYWSNVDYNLVQRSDLSGNQVKTLRVVTYPQGVAVDKKSKKLYVAEVGTPQIFRMDLNGENPEVLITEGLVDPDDLVIGPKGRSIYWIDIGLHAVRKADLDKGAIIPENFVDSSTFKLPTAIAIDKTANRLYWADSGLDEILSSDLKGTTLEVVTSNIGKPESLALDEVNHLIFWADQNELKLYQFDLNNKKRTVIADLQGISGFHMDLKFIPDHVGNNSH